MLPDVLGEGAASLLPEVDRPALLWTIELDARARTPAATRRERATVHSRAADSYADVQAALDRGDALTVARVAPGDRDLAARPGARAGRGEHRLDRPEEGGRRDADGRRLEYEAPLPVESWNAQISHCSRGVRRPAS